MTIYDTYVRGMLDVHENMIGEFKDKFPDIMAENRIVEEKVNYECYEESMKNAKLLTIPDYIMTSLQLTNPPKKFISKLPFDNLFLSICLKLNDILIINGMLAQTNGKSITLWPLICLNDGVKQQFFNEPISFFEGSFDEEDRELLKEGGLSIKEIKAFENFIKNLLSFFNDPRIEFKQEAVHIKKSNSGLGYVPMPEKLYSVIPYEVRKYLMDVHNKTMNKRPFLYKFLVRGHWRALTSTKWKAAQGKTIWIMPFYKGHGMIVPQEWTLKMKR
jgi:hypothetical protein